MQGENKKNLNLKKTAFITVLVIVVLWLITLFSLITFPSNLRGTFGDMFGSINALFSGLALAELFLPY